MERVTVGKSAPTDVALCYVNGIADTSLVDSTRSRLTGLDLDAVNMTQESIAESLSVGRTFNPVPRVRYTERPDAAAAMLEEGSVILLCDNSPQAMILPTSVFDFLQESDDFYLPSVIGSYLRLTRLLIFGMSLFLTPLWYCCVKNAAALPTWLRFLDIGEPAAVPLILQLVIAEVMIDGLKHASLNTPNTLSSSLSVVGGLILGDFAVEAGWFSPQTILYMAIVSIAAFTQQSYELGYAFKFSRMLLLVLTELFGVVGLVMGLVFVLTVMASTRTVSGARSSRRGSPDPATVTASAIRSMSRECGPRTSLACTSRRCSSSPTA
jgi:stage V sporulation protein AF